MKVQRKLLTKEQKTWICDTHTCDNCPLLFKNGTLAICYERTEKLANEIKNFWNAEVDI